MADGQTQTAFDPVAEYRKNWTDDPRSDEEIAVKLQDPANFRKAFPDYDYSDKDADTRIRKYMQDYSLKTGKGMQVLSLQKAHEALSGTGEQGYYDAKGRKISGPSGERLAPIERAEQELADSQTLLGERMNRASKSPMPISNAAALFAAPGLGAGVAEKGLLQGAVLPVLKPIAKTAIGTTAGRYVGRDVGGIVGHPEAGATIGGIVGGVYGLMGGKVPTKMSMLRSILEEEPAAETAATKSLPTIEPAEVKPIASEAPSAEIPKPTQPAPVGKITPKTLKGYFNPGRSEPVKLDELIDQAAGVKPLRPNVPLKEQLTSAPAATLEEVDPVKAKYPDPAVRQMVRANGEGIVEAVGNNRPELMKQVHDLTRVELRQALINAGEDMGQTTVSNSKFAGEGSIPREEAFNRLLKKGLKPEQIVELAKKTSEAGFKGGINVRGAEASMKSPDTETNIRSLSSEIETMKAKLRNARNTPKAEKDALQRQIDDYQGRLDELRKKGT